MTDNDGPARGGQGRAPDPVRGLFLLGIMLGGAVGAAIGLLYAPRPGAQVRRERDRGAERGERAERDKRDRHAGRPVPPAAPAGEAPL